MIVFVNRFLIVHRSIWCRITLSCFRCFIFFGNFWIRTWSILIYVFFLKIYLIVRIVWVFLFLFSSRFLSILRNFFFLFFIFVIWRIVFLVKWVCINLVLIPWVVIILGWCCIRLMDWSIWSFFSSLVKRTISFCFMHWNLLLILNVWWIIYLLGRVLVLNGILITRFSVFFLICMKHCVCFRNLCLIFFVLNFCSWLWSVRIVCCLVILITRWNLGCWCVIGKHVIVVVWSTVGWSVLREPFRIYSTVYLIICFIWYIYPNIYYIVGLGVVVILPLLAFFLFFETF